MNWDGLLYLGITFGLFVVFAIIVIRTYSRKRKEKLEGPKHRMLEDD
ncbi:MAG: cbb3-type cytochrome c oxidase subunit 3 [Desulfobulbales bacterium]|nr:cbb3-type cytochrome c oxidase subunit 3 [Desulfobulbales bacterium]